MPLRTILNLAAFHHRGDIISGGSAYLGLSNNDRAQASYFDQCILTHKSLRKIFTSLDHLCNLVSMWTIFHAFRWFFTSRTLERYLCFDLTEDMWLEMGLTPENLPNFALGVNYFQSDWIHLKWLALKRITGEFQDLSLYLSKELLGHNSHLPFTTYQYCVSGALLKLKTLRCEQLLHGAEMVDKNGSMLKKASDPTSEARTNAKHISDRLRGDARSMAKNHMLAFHKLKTQYFRYDIFPVVPLDSCFRCFLKILEHYPLNDKFWKAAHREERSIPTGSAGEAIVVERLFKKTTMALSAKTKPPKALYPAPVAAAIRCAIQGMAYVYLPPTPRTCISSGIKVPRTKYTPFSAKAFKTVSGADAIFVTPWYSHLEEIYYDGKMCRDSGLRSSRRIMQLYDPRELEWLESFLVACKYMAKMDVDGRDLENSKMPQPHCAYVQESTIIKGIEKTMTPTRLEATIIVLCRGYKRLQGALSHALARHSIQELLRDSSKQYNYSRI